MHTFVYQLNRTGRTIRRFSAGTGRLSGSPRKGGSELQEAASKVFTSDFRYQFRAEATATPVHPRSVTFGNAADGSARVLLLAAWYSRASLPVAGSHAIASTSNIAA